MAHAGYARGSRRYGCPGSSATTSARTSGASPASRVRVLEHEYAAGREEPAVGRNLLGHPAQRRELEPRVHQVEPRLGQGAGEQVVGDQLDVRRASRAHHRLRLVQHLLRIVGPRHRAGLANPPGQDAQPPEAPTPHVDRLGGTKPINRCDRRKPRGVWKNLERQLL